MREFHFFGNVQFYFSFHRIYHDDAVVCVVIVFKVTSLEISSAKKMQRFYKIVHTIVVESSLGR